MATGGGDQVWTWKKRKSVAASLTARRGNEITTMSVVAVLGIFLLHTLSMGVKTAIMCSGVSKPIRAFAKMGVATF